MSVRPTIQQPDEFDALVIRTDFTDDHAWDAVASSLGENWGDGELESCALLVDDPGWAAASVDEVLAALPDDVEVVFLADRVTMQFSHQALLAVTSLTREDCDDDEEYAALTEFGSEFRTDPPGVSDIYSNLSIANMGFEEYAAAARQDPEGVYRSF